MITFENARVFDGVAAEPLDGATVVIEGGTIKEVSDRRRGGSGERIDLAGRTLMPGLIDLHTHPWISELNLGRVSRQRTEYLSVYAAGWMRRALDRGFTTIRDAGGTDPSFALAIEKGFIPAPRLFPSGRMMSQTGGHTDWREANEADRGVGNAMDDGMTRFTAVVDGPDAMRHAVREELRRGATQIKLMLSGGVASPTDPLERVQFSDEEIRVAVEEVTRRGTYCFAHCIPLNSIQKALEMGIRTIEHGIFIDDQTARAVAGSADTYVVPTLAVTSAFSRQGRALGLPEASLEKLGGVHDVAMGSLEIMKRAGVKMGYGTDLLGPLEDQQLIEFELRADVLSAHEILVSATSLAAEILGQNGRLGVVAPGAVADLIVVDGDPLANVRIMNQGGRNIPMIMQAGVFHRREH
ncbi:metal-dependent hydrolase family protein [Oryzicola mucosus]|uniref:Amidohydrolase family protein n=1 Tax=Oryzicola mucosus TaxID=2767425 RepID=A0A8J6U1G0_9HYPH|nr:amidohydrolase family protein [Oryzicola mucosus]MBD0416891.1 amidohydrolase family protein [Oryzicola mucosus]